MRTIMRLDLFETFVLCLHIRIRMALFVYFSRNQLMYS